MKVVNLTPHKINIFTDGLSGYEEVASIEPEPTPARVAVERVRVGEIRTVNGQQAVDSDGFHGVALYETKYGQIENLPDPEENTIYIVSLLVRQAAPERNDLYNPGELLRDATGQPTGCIGLSR